MINGDNSFLNFIYLISIYLIRSDNGDGSYPDSSKCTIDRWNSAEACRRQFKTVSGAKPSQFFSLCRGS